MPKPIKVISETEIDSLPSGSKAWIARKFVPAQTPPFEIRVGIIKGAKPGPTLAELAGQHGMEHMGPVVLRDIFEELDPADISGTMYVCPSSNPRALERDYEFFPEFEDLSKLDNYYYSMGRHGHDPFGIGRSQCKSYYNMNRLWPAGGEGGDGKKGIASDIAKWLWTLMVEPADVLIDNHALRADKAQVFIEDPVIPWASVLGIEGVYTRPMEGINDPYYRGLLSFQAIVAGKIGITIEYSQQHGLKEHERAMGRFGVLNLMRAMGMIPGKVEFPKNIWLLRNRFNPPEFVYLKSDKVGHFHFRADEYSPVKKGGTLVEIRDIATHDLLDEIKAPSDGLMLSRTFRAVNKPGDEICRFHIAPELLAGPGKTPVIPPLEVAARKA